VVHVIPSTVKLTLDVPAPTAAPQLLIIEATAHGARLTGSLERDLSPGERLEVVSHQIGATSFEWRPS
jgi:hypothetical protein